MAKDGRSRDQKRKDKLAKKKRSLRKIESLAYMGDKFKSDKLIPTLMHAEIGIYESFVITEQRLLDQTVASAVEKLVRQMRAGRRPCDREHSSQLGNSFPDRMATIQGPACRRTANNSRVRRNDACTGTSLPELHAPHSRISDKATRRQG